MMPIEQIREYSSELVRAGHDAKSQYGGKEPVSYLANAMIQHGEAIREIVSLIPTDDIEAYETASEMRDELTVRDRRIDELQKQLLAVTVENDALRDKVNELGAVIEAASLRP